ncbi:hypothetical protein [Nocardia cyriacigeorgica]|uniref:hypothetical protein n=1 Tax=Nocardia cyriacigeorgica TaxID=135487 RepID=UPI0024542A42|nr:hypothetical protein [Nocardia cyriacigeorgica]
MTQPASAMSYADALAIASAAYLAAQAAPDPLESLATMARASAVAVDNIQRAAVTAITALWRALDPYDEAAVVVFAEDAGRILVPAQRSVAQITAATHSRQFAALGRPEAVVAPDIPDDVRGALAERTARTLRATPPDGDSQPEPRPAAPAVTDPSPAPRPSTPQSAQAEPAQVARRRSRARVTYRDGTTRTASEESARTSRVMVRAASEYRYSRSTGVSHTDASRAAETRIDALVDGNLQIARSLVEQRALEQIVDLDRTVVGYRRIIHPELSRGGVCGMCVVAADRTYNVGELKAIHHRCKCTVLPRFKGWDPGRDLNSADLQALYDAAGGTTPQLLKRVRFRLTAHTELGLMLVAANGSSSVPYFPPPENFPAPERRSVPLGPGERASGRSRTRTPARTAARTPARAVEGQRELAERHLPALRESLQRLRASGRSEDSPPVRYHLEQIAKFESYLASA